MDHEDNLARELNAITDLRGKTVVELAAGTGRLTGLLAKEAALVHACDISENALAFAEAKFLEEDRDNTVFHVADSRNLPIEDSVADLTVEGWSLLHVALGEDGQRLEEWKQQVDSVLDEAIRVTKPGGDVVLLETLGTGKHRPAPPNVFLAELYDHIERNRNFARRPWIKTDYKFSDLDEAVRLTGMFWGKRLSDFVTKNRMLILPECTGLWHWQKPTAKHESNP